MNEKYYLLGIAEDNKLVKILRIIFGFACIIMGFYWAIYNLSAPESEKAMWVTIAFIIGFGISQVWAGLGKAVRYIALGNDYVRMKQNSLKRPERISAADLSRIEILPLSIVFIRVEGKKTILRMGTINYETNEKIVDSLIEYSENNNIPYEIKEEKIF